MELYHVYVTPSTV